MCSRNRQTLVFCVTLLVMLRSLPSCSTFGFVVSSTKTKRYMNKSNALAFSSSSLLPLRRRRLSVQYVSRNDITDEEALERTKRQLDILKGESTTSSYSSTSTTENSVQSKDKEIMYQQLIKQSANSLKDELKKLKLSTKGRKPDLARRLVDYNFISKEDDDNDGGAHLDDENIMNEINTPQQWIESDDIKQPIRNFASISLSNTAGTALATAGFVEPTDIQSSALPLLVNERESLILHAETGSGKTLCYLLPITERLWDEQNNEVDASGSYALVLTPTRELAAQVAGIASVLAPPNSVRLITTPSNLVRMSFEDKEKSEEKYGGRKNTMTQNEGTKLIVGSAKSIMTSLFGDSKMPSPPTTKPEAKMFLANVKYVVLDEVDRLLDVKKVRGKTSKYYKKHEKPAASILSSVARMTLGQAQVVAASATVGRPLRRELARVLGLTPDECPQIIRGIQSNHMTDTDSTRAVTLPESLQHYVMPSDGSTTGGLLTAAAFFVKNLPQLESRGRRTLFVIASGCGIQLRDAIGALRHFGVSPNPMSLLDVMEAEGTDNLIETYRCISASGGLGEKSSSKLAFSESEGYMLLAVEETVRGIHLDNLDTVVIVGRPKGPDEYVHIAGRAGRAGKPGKVISVVSYEQATALSSWEGMLGIDFIPLDESDASSL